jgi:hypothetical protein
MNGSENGLMHRLAAIAILLVAIGGAQADELKQEDQKQQERERVQDSYQIITCGIAGYCLRADGKWQSIYDEEKLQIERRSDPKSPRPAGAR